MVVGKKKARAGSNQQAAPTGLERLPAQAAERMALSIGDLAQKIEDQKTVIANERDKLRSLYEELEDIVESLDVAVEDLDSGLHAIRNAIDRMSEYV